MPLGIEQNNLAPSMIQDNGQALVQGIRQIGQQISGHLTELQTKRDLAALGQEAQSLSVDSNDFPVQLAQLVTRHPLAARDERGKMLLAPLGQAHGFWRAEEADARAFNRAMTMQGLRTEATRTLAEEQEARIRSRPAKPVAPRGSVPAPGLPGWSFDKDAGEFNPPSPEIASQLPVPGATKPMTEYQRAQLRRAERKDKIAAINKEIDQFDSNIVSGTRAYEAAFKREMDAATDQKKQHELDKTAIGKDTDALKAEKAKRLEILRKLREEDEFDAAIPADEELAELPPVPGNALVPSGALAPAVPGANVRRVRVINPDGKLMDLREDQLDAALQAGWKRQ